MKIGVLGGGQLGRMMALAGIPLGMQFRFLDPSPSATARDVGEIVNAPYDDPAALLRFIDKLDVVTFEFENIPSAITDKIDKHVQVFPNPLALQLSQSRLLEKEFLKELDIPIAEFRSASTQQELSAAIAELKMPVIVKTARLGYDGKGQYLVRELHDTFQIPWNEGLTYVVEKFVPFKRELSVIAVRSKNGQINFYPLFENTHSDGILRTTRAPAGRAIDSGAQKQAEQYAKRIMEELGYVGILTLELFDTGDKERGLIANEIAPRVHNSGHLTIEGAYTSQFENHLRAITGLPLGNTALRGECGMVNLIGTTPPLEKLLALGDVHVHMYGKSPREGRKLGHVTVRRDSRKEVDRAIATIEGAR